MNSAFSRGRPRPGQFCLYKGAPCLNLGMPHRNETLSDYEKERLIRPDSPAMRWMVPPNMARLGILDPTGWKHTDVVVIPIMSTDLKPVTKLEQIPEPRREEIQRNNPDWTPRP